MTRIHTHPGEVLREEFMEPLSLSANKLALALRVPATRIGDIIRAERPRAVTADTALRLGRFFGTTPMFWLNLQSAYDVSMAEAVQGREIEREVRPRDEIIVRSDHVVIARKFPPPGRARAGRSARASSTRSRTASIANG